MFIAALFTIVRTLKQPRCPSADEWIRKLWCIYTMEYPSNEYSGLISFRMDWLDLLAIQGLSRVFSNTTVQKH